MLGYLDPPAHKVFQVTEEMLVLEVTMAVLVYLDSLLV